MKTMKRTYEDFKNRSEMSQLTAALDEAIDRSYLDGEVLVRNRMICFLVAVRCFRTVR